MPLFMDIHDKVDGLTGQAVAAAHERDVVVGSQRGVQYLHYWYDEGTGKVFCLVDAPSAEAAIDVHREAHGLLADTLTAVRQGA